MDEDVVVGLLPSFLRESYKRVQSSGRYIGSGFDTMVFTFISKTLCAYSTVGLLCTSSYQVAKVNEFVRLNLFKPNVSTWDKLTLLILEQFESYMV